MAITYTTDFKGQNNGVGAAITSNTLTVATGDFITIVVTFPDNQFATAWTVSNTGTAISWTKQAETNNSGTTKTVLWSGTAGATPPTTVTVTVTAGTQLDIGRVMSVMVHTGAHATTPLPAGNIFTGATGETDVSQAITPTSTGSCLWMQAGDWGATNSFVAAANCTLVATPYHESGQHTVAAIRPTTQPRTTAAAFTIGETDTAGQITWIAFEVQAHQDTPLNERHLPEYIGKGTFSSAAAAPTPTLPSGIATGDLLLLVCESANQAIATPTNYTQVTNSPQSTGTANAAGGVRLGVFYRFHTAGDSAPTITDSGDHTSALIVAFRGVDPTTPINTTAGTAQAATTSVSFQSVTTTTDRCLIVLCFANDRDLAASGNLTSITNSNLTGITSRHDETVATGFGGGVAVITGVKVVAGSTGATTATNAASVTNASLTIALQGTLRELIWTKTVKNTLLRM